MQNNYAIGTIRDLQRAYHDGREIGTSFVNERTGKLWNPDFVKMTEAMGGRGIRVDHPDQFGDAYREAIRSSIPTVIDVVINRDTGMPITGHLADAADPGSAADVRQTQGEVNTCAEQAARARSTGCAGRLCDGWRLRHVSRAEFRPPPRAGEAPTTRLNSRPK